MRLQSWRDPLEMKRDGLHECDPLMDLDSFHKGMGVLLKRHRIAGLSAGVIIERELVWSRGYGFSDLESDVHCQADTSYDVASLTKIFTSILLLQMSEQGKLDLDQNIADFLPNDFDGPFSERERSLARVRHVLSHTSAGVPGESYAYDGARFASLRFVLEALAEASLPRLLSERILDPLGMKDTAPGLDTPAPRHRHSLANLAKPYRMDDTGEYIPNDYPAASLSASAGLISTVEDLAKLDAAIDEHRLISAESQELGRTR